MRRDEIDSHQLRKYVFTDYKTEMNGARRAGYTSGLRN